MADTKLQTILHISDLHFGDRLWGHRDAPIPPFVGQIRMIEGLLGHHWLAVEQLERFVYRLKQSDPGTMLVVSGDLTVDGSSGQFDRVEGFLDQASLKSQLGVELGFADWLDRTVPGNHDHWPGLGIMLGPSTPAFSYLFPGPYPMIRTPVPIGGGVTVRFIVVDSDGQVGAVSLDRFMARGRFDQQLLDLRGLETPKPSKEIRVLVVHHSILDLDPNPPAPHAAFPRKPQSSPPKFLEIEPRSLALLEEIIVETEIQVVMSGHLHVPRLTTLTASSNRGTCEIFDARCGTTTQRDVYPSALQKTIGSAREPLPPNALILHEIWLRGDRLFWEAEVYRRIPGSGFTRVGQRQSFALT